ncbi:hypothetical protein TGDOM2_210815 [Toxoplasma gondii GAB2-2007-GAL-DOM2]|uniref:Uncharacterized protein n=3 Tax=Toxoplasma gondii TaxID=5811 RepID=A0A086K2W3_TOXGO|nr:hypothetical protein TGDOM2_210815 [Toxoplasma gondii GAB2-2007-GAL-DOM2]KFG38731.1 hypothetical protein TGFOU_210815 [Toxoplasma gondii FOU]KFG99533.1 hypothetical protein TGVAND_210815 [Toxoplasma gondii VAND]
MLILSTRKTPFFSEDAFLQTFNVSSPTIQTHGFLSGLYDELPTGSYTKRHSAKKITRSIDATENNGEVAATQRNQSRQYRHHPVGSSYDTPTIAVEFLRPSTRFGDAAGRRIAEKTCIFLLHVAFQSFNSALDCTESPLSVLSRHSHESIKIRCVVSLSMN